MTYFRCALPVRVGRVALWLFVSLVCVTGIVGRVWAAPTLTVPPGGELPSTFQAGKNYTLRLVYTDPKGDEISKSKAVFIDEAPSGRKPPMPASNITGDPSTGATLEWNINGFEQGGHRGHFEVSALTGTVRYPTEGDYVFGVEALGTKIITMVVGVAVALLVIPISVYLIARSLKRQGDPSQAARMGLFFGILACCALFIYLFLNIFGPLVYAILVVGVLAFIALVLGRR
jgi:hypothetical protein